MSTDPAVTEEVVASPPATRRSKGERLPRTSLFVAVVLVGVITMETVIIAGLILLRGHDTPDGLWALAGGGMGSLGTFLARGQGST